MALSFRNATAKTVKEMMPLLTSRSQTTQSKMKASYSTTIRGQKRKSIKEELFPKGKPMGDYVPVYVALGMIGLSVTLGLYTAKEELMHGPDVRVKKSKRETLPEVVDPDSVARDSEEFLKKSFFRKVGHVQDLNTSANNNPSVTGEPRVESLKTVGVNPVELASSNG